MTQDRTLESLPADVVAKLKTEHGDVIEVPTVEGPFAFRRPTRQEYRFFMTMLGDDKKKAGAPEYLVTTCRVAPSKEDFEKAADRSPGIVTTITNPLLNFAGLDGDVAAKKH